MIDRVKLYVYGGDGGDGAVSFRREKFIPFGGPDGGDGGDGGSVEMVVDPGRTTLFDLKHQRHYRAGRGENGKSKSRYGRKGQDLEIRVPPGTIVREIKEDGSEAEMGDLVNRGQGLIVGRGGRGGRGNEHYATSVKQAPRYAQSGGPGEKRELILDLKLLADVGLVGRPNAGKSTLINQVSAARSKTADYPFTTLEPKLGVVPVGYETFVIADIPGLIEGAHSGHGLGHEFLRHIERTRLLIHLIDGTTVDAMADFREINTELVLYNASMRDKPRFVVVNKIDIPEVRDRLPEMMAALAGTGATVYTISAATGEGVEDLMKKALEMLQQIPPPSIPGGTEMKVFRPKPVK